MANGFESEEEQIEAIKRWWHENGHAVVIGVAVAIAGWVGWNWWQSQQQQQAIAAADAYHSVLRALDEDDRQGAREQAQQLASEHGGSVQAALANLRVAKADAGADDYEVAEAGLRRARNAASDDALNQLATLRLAKVLDQRGNRDEALELLEPVPENAYAMRYQELTGDIRAAMGERDAAVEAYRAAIDALQGRYGEGRTGARQRAQQRGRIELKLTDLNADAEASS